MTTPASTIRCEYLSVEFGGGLRAVADVDLIAPASKILSLVGPSGCGKTTLLRAMAGLQTPASGTVAVDPPAAGRRGEIAFVFQQPSLLAWRTTVENVMLPLELTGRGTRTKRKSIATEMLRRVDLSDALNRYPNQLSGGMKMRVSIARALVTQPSVLLLDEPFAALDDMLRNQLGELVLKLWSEQKFTAVIVTHNIAESIFLSHRIAVMQRGTVIRQFENALSFPRTEQIRSTPAFGQFFGVISSALRGESGDEI